MKEGNKPPAPYFKTRTFLSGCCMGTADLIPGISGGTIALILGVWEPLIAAICAFSGFSWRQPIQSLRAIPWSFLLTLLSGIFFAISLFVHLVTTLLKDPFKRPLLFATFFGLVVASAHIVARRIASWRTSFVLIALSSALLAFMLTLLPTTTPFNSTKVTLFDGSLQQALFIFGCGAFAICAALLPGISGSYMLNIIGMYEKVMFAISSFLSGLASFSFAQEAFTFLLLFGLGVLFGALCFARVAQWLLDHYHDVTIAALLGFMLGALGSLWPFWSQQADSLGPSSPILPGLTDPITWLALLFASAGAAIVLLLEQLAKNAPR